LSPRQFGECRGAGERLTPSFGQKIAAASSGDDTNPPDEEAPDFTMKLFRTSDVNLVTECKVA